MSYEREEYPQPEQPQPEDLQPEQLQSEQPLPEQPQPEQAQLEELQPEQSEQLPPKRSQPKRAQPKRTPPKRTQQARSSQARPQPARSQPARPRKGRTAAAGQSKQEKRQFSPILIGAAAIGVLLILLVLFLVLRGGNPQARALVDLNLRAGPGATYPVQGSLKKDEQVIVVGRNKDGSWLLVETKDGKKLWVSGGAEFVQVDKAAVDRLPVVEAAGVAYNANNPNVIQVLSQIPLVVNHDGIFTCASHGGLDHLLSGVAEGNVIGPHSGDFAYLGADKGGAVLFRYTSGTFVLIRDNPIARFPGDKESLPLDQALQMFEKGEIVWTGSVGAWPGRGVTGCDLSAKP